jgi:hypothetical protein
MPRTVRLKVTVYNKAIEEVTFVALQCESTMIELCEPAGIQEGANVYKV